MEHNPSAIQMATLPPPGSTSPRKGIIRIVQHGRASPGEQAGKQWHTDRSGVPSEAAWSAHGSSSKRDRMSEDKQARHQTRQDNEAVRERIERADIMRREQSLSRPGREGRGMSVSKRTEEASRYVHAAHDEERSETSESKSSNRRHTGYRQWADEGRRQQGTRGGGGGGGGWHGSHETGRLEAEGAQGFGSRSIAGSGSGGKLFDPRRDDPVRFAALRKGLGITSSVEPGPSSLSMAGQSDTHSMASSATPSVTTMSTTSSDGRERRRRRGPGSRTTTDSGEGGAKRKGQPSGVAGDSSASDNNSYVVELKRRYRDVAVVERKLQEEHRQASEAQRKHHAEVASSSQAPNTMARTISSGRAHGDRYGFNPDGTLRHAYWLDLIAEHRALAESHVAFMEAALRPGLPASLHSLPQTYKIPTRLWHTAFHSLLERFRQLLPDMHSCVAMRDQGFPANDRQQIGEVIDLMTDYIYFAYAYYSNLLESELFKEFRSSWIENLGDLARYRMAVAKFMSMLGIKDGVKHGAERRDSGSHARPTDFIREHVTGNSTNAKQGAVDDEEDEVEKVSARMGKDQASIGAAAAQDWDLEEKEIWRSTARGWYAKGLAEVPGTGRLHHHLGILSRDDDLRALYHFCKSLTTSHPYPGTRESMLPLFERSSQARRIGEDATITDLFVHIHGMLFTRVQMDDFPEIFERFKRHLITQITADDMATGTSLSTSSWMMMATANIAAILNYGGDDAIEGQKDQDSFQAVTKGAPGGATPLLADQEEFDEGDVLAEDEENLEEGESKDVGSVTEAKDEEPNGTGGGDLPYATVMALRFTFDMLDLLISFYLNDLKQAANPYITIVLTFFSQECKQDSVLRKMEKFVPWERLVTLGNSVPPIVEPIDPRHETSLKIRGDAVPLPEDWCLRGMAWIGRRVYERGFWKPHKIERLGLRSSLSLFESEMDMIERCTRCPCQSHEDSSTEGNGDGDDDDDDDDDDDGDDLQLHTHIRPKLTLSLLRWKRIVHALTILIKTVPGLDFDIFNGSAHARHGRLVIAPPLQHKLVDWQADATRLEVEQAIGHMKLAALEGRLDPAEVSFDDDDEDDDEVDAGDGVAAKSSFSGHSTEVQELMRRRSELRNQLRDAKAANFLRPPLSSDRRAAKGAKGAHPRSDPSLKSVIPRPQVRMVPGYTTLLLDTNVMLAPTDILNQLVESSRWLIVVPLSVVTELDGLKKRKGDVGKRAQDAIAYLEVKVKTKHVKVQTSRGNYLSDLRFRTEDIDFSAVAHCVPLRTSDGDQNRTFGESSSQSFAGDSKTGTSPPSNPAARSVDDVILRCLAWQAGSHFRNRLLIFCPDDKERAKREAEIARPSSPSVARAVLVTLDRNLRIKARFQELAAIGPADLVDLLLDSPHP